MVKSKNKQIKKIFYRKKRKRIIVISIIAVLIIGLLSLGYTIYKSKIKPNSEDKFSTFSLFHHDFDLDRIADTDPVQMSSKVSSIGWDKCDNVILINKDDITSGLISLPISQKFNAPILFTDNNTTLNNSVLNEISRLEAKNIIILGSEDLISSKIENQLTDKRLSTNRITGKDTTDLCINVAKNLMNNETFLLCSTNNLDEFFKTATVAMDKEIPLLITDNKTEVYNYFSNNLTAKGYYIENNLDINDLLDNPNIIKLDNKKLNNNLHQFIEENQPLNADTIVFAPSNDMSKLIATAAMCGNAKFQLIKIKDNSIENPIEYYLVKNSNKINHIITVGSEEQINSALVQPESWGKSFTNTKKPLFTQTYDGSNQAVHPSVIYIDKGWNGYKYWMGITPYPQGNDNMENPQILVSNDGVNFAPFNGLNKALAIPDDVNKGSHYSDIALCFANDTLEVYFRYNPPNSTSTGPDNGCNKLFVMKTSDGVNWTSPKLVLDTTTFNEKYDFVSPKIIYDEGVYKIWFSNYSANLYYTETKNWKTFKKVSTCNITDKPSNFSLWHQDIIKTSLGYECIIAGYVDGKFSPQNLYYCYSKDGINFSPAKLLLTPSNRDGFDNESLYKSCLVRVPDKYLLYYSARNKNGEWRIGLAENTNSLMNLPKEN